MPELVLAEDRGAVRHVVMNRAEKRNALNLELVVAIGDALRAAADDPAVRVVVLRGAGPAFSAGMDVGALAGAAGAPERLLAFRRACLEAWNLAEEMAKPVVAQVHGACLGGALELALACDLRVFAADAVAGLLETRLGLIPDLGGEDAERIGLANRVGPADRLDQVTQELVDELLACAPVAVGLAKRLVDVSARPALSTTLEMELAAQRICAGTEDVEEGVRAAGERRAARFTGR